MSFWQAKADNVQSGVEDMVLLTKATDERIVDNLQKRYMSDLIYTSIGPVLIAVNPYKSLPCFTEKHIEQYHGSVDWDVLAAHELPPHIFATAEGMFQNMLSEEENQCVIISGESGAGKTETSKLLMNYIAAVSGKGGTAVDHVKSIILGSNPLLESFGNAKTLRNNNSSRFGKYFEIKFSRGGQPLGGTISNFLLEKSRVVGQKGGERNYHVFYQLTKGTSAQEKEWLGMAKPDCFFYLNQSKTYDADGVNDVEDYKDMRESMHICGMDEQLQNDILQLVAGILHLGNIDFFDDGQQTTVTDANSLAYPAYLLGVDQNFLFQKLTSRFMSTGGNRGSAYDVPLNREQSCGSRDALAKSLYSRMFDFIVASVNKAIHKDEGGNERLLSLGVLDIFGFEIFEKNGFEQLCINYVNEKLQQVFIELTLKTEQEEYMREGIQWTPIDYFNNKIVVDLIEGKRPVGVMAVLDDVCVQLHAVAEGADETFVQKLGMAVGTHPHFQGGNVHFLIKHYAGPVEYDCHGFCDANRDTMYRDLIQLVQSSNNPFIASLFPEDVAVDDKKRPTTTGFKIRNQSHELVTTLMKCTPSYVRCLKPNERKRSRDWDQARVQHQVRYLNLRENVNVRRAGFCYRNTFDKFIRRFGVLTKYTFPLERWQGPLQDAVAYLMQSVNMDMTQWQLGQTKVFIKTPESLFLLEEMRERVYHDYAKKIQRAYRRYRARRYYLECKKKSMNVLYGRKERRRNTLNRDYLGDYINYLDNPVLRSMVGKNEKVRFCDVAIKYDRRFKAQEWDLFVTETALVMLGWEKVTEGTYKGQFQKAVKRRVPLKQIAGISLSTLCDDFVVVHIANEFDQVLECKFKSELISILVDIYQRVYNVKLDVNFADNIQYTVKKTRWEGAGLRILNFVPSDRISSAQLIQTNNKGTDIAVPIGLPRDSQPGQQDRQVTNSVAMRGGPGRGQPQGYGQAPQQQGYGRPPPPPQQNYGVPPQPQYGYEGQPPQQQVFGRPPPPPQQQSFGSSPNLQQQGFGRPPPPPQQQSFGSSPNLQQQGLGRPPPPAQQQSFGRPPPPPQQPGLSGSSTQQQSFGRPPPPPQQPGFGGSTPALQQQGFGRPPPQQGYGGQAQAPTQQVYARPPPSGKQGQARPPGFNAPAAMQPAMPAMPTAQRPINAAPTQGNFRPQQNGQPSSATGSFANVQANQFAPSGQASFGANAYGGSQPSLASHSTGANRQQQQLQQAAGPNRGSANTFQQKAMSKASPAPPPPKPAMEQCRALYDYQAQEADELSIKVGDILSIVSKDNEGWWTGMCNGKRGLFPSNYVEPI